MQYFKYHSGFYIKINFPGPVLCKFYTCMLFICGSPSSVFENHQHWSPGTGENWILLSQSSWGLLQRHLFSSGSQRTSHFSCLREIPGCLISFVVCYLHIGTNFPSRKSNQDVNLIFLSLFCIDVCLKWAVSLLWFGRKK